MYDSNKREGLIPIFTFLDSTQIYKCNSVQCKTSYHLIWHIPCFAFFECLIEESEYIICVATA